MYFAKKTIINTKNDTEKNSEKICEILQSKLFVKKIVHFDFLNELVVSWAAESKSRVKMFVYRELKILNQFLNFACPRFESIILNLANLKIFNSDLNCLIQKIAENKFKKKIV